MPHYNAKEATGYVKELLGSKYNGDTRPVLDSLKHIAKLGVVEEKEKGKGVFKYISKYPYYDGVGRF